jgi:serine/threonine protein kinase
MFPTSQSSKYEIAPKAIGQGGMGTIYLARDVRAQRSVAIKKLALSKTTVPDPPLLLVGFRPIKYHFDPADGRQ